MLSADLISILGFRRAAGAARHPAASRAESCSSNAMQVRHMVDGVDRLGRANKRDKQQQGLGGP